jgi:hypothetical protein
MTRQEAEDLFLDRIRDLHFDSWPALRRWDTLYRPILRKDLKEFVAMIERELLPIA